MSFLNDFSLKEWQTNDTGSLIVDPVWTKHLGGAVTKDQPAAYKRTVGASPSHMTTELKLAASSSLTSQATITVRGAGAVDFSGEAAGKGVQAWPSDLFNLTSEPIPDYNGAFDPLGLSWEYLVRRLDGTWPSWDSGVQTNGTSHRIYCTFDTPIPAPSPTAPVYDLALQKICLEYANGKTTISEIASAASTGIDNEICYDPSVNVSGHVLNIYGAGSCQCSNNAELLELLAKSTGIAGEARYFYGGVTAGTASFFRYANSVPGALDGVEVSMRTTAAGHDNARPFSHFTFHVQTLIGGFYYDPSYGSVGIATSSHQCTAVGAGLLEMSQAVFISSAINPCFWSDDHGPDPTATGCP